MRRLLQSLGITASFWQIIEAGLIGLFFVQALRYLIGAYYSRIASASITGLLTEEVLSQIAGTRGLVLPDVVASEITFLVYMIAIPLLLVLLGRFRILLVAGAAMTAIGRTLIIAETDISAAVAAALTVGGGFFFITMLIHGRPQVFPFLFILGVGVDQIFRALGNTLDPTWSPTFFTVQLALSLAVIVLSVANYLAERRAYRQTRQQLRPGLLPFWGSVSLGAMIFLQITLLGLPNLIAGRTGGDYTSLVPLLVIATLLPIVPWVRGRARGFLGIFDSNTRGWVWLLLLSLLLVTGTRVGGLLAAAALVLAQFAISMIWFWMVRPRAEKERNFSGLWVVLGALTFGILALFDIFTYEYAYIRPFADPFAVLNNTLLPLLRGFRGLGFVVILLATLLAALPMLQSQRRIPWRDGSLLHSFLLALMIGGTSVGATFAARPPVILGVSDPESIRVGTYNLHGGFSEFYDYDLEGIARTIEQSGVNVVLLQEVEAGRTTSFGVDQPLWLARRLGMDVRFFPTNEGLQGLAVLSDVEIVFDDGNLLASVGQQTGLQRVQIRPAQDVIVTLYNTWLGLLLESVGERSIEEQEQDQQQQLNQMIQIIDQHHPGRQLGRTVVGGTFNNIPDSPLIQRMQDVGFSDPFAGSPIERSATLVRTGLSARVDYVWIYPEMADGVGVMDTAASDHRLAFVNIRLQTQP